MVGFCSVIRLASGPPAWTARARLTAGVVAVPPASPVRVACALPWFPNPITLSLMFSNPTFNPVAYRRRLIPRYKAVRAAARSRTLWSVFVRTPADQYTMPTAGPLSPSACLHLVSAVLPLPEQPSFVPSNSTINRSALSAIGFVLGQRAPGYFSVGCQLKFCSWPSVCHFYYSNLYCFFSQESH